MDMICLLLFLGLLLPTAFSYIRCAACVDKKIEYNHDMTELIFNTVPFGMPNCSPYRRPKQDPSIPQHLWIVSCEHSCVSLDWKRGPVTDRMRYCSTDLLRDMGNTNSSMKLPVAEIRRYPGLEFHVVLCNNDLCNYDRDLVTEALEMTTTAVSTTSTAITTTVATTTADISQTITTSTTTTDLPSTYLFNETTSNDSITHVPTTDHSQMRDNTSTPGPSTRKVHKPKAITPTVIYRNGRSSLRLHTEKGAYQNGIICLMAMMIIVY